MEELENIEIIEEEVPEVQEVNESDVVPTVSDPQQTGESLEELLEEFIQNRIAEQNEDSEENEVFETENNSEVSISDYSSYYSEIIEILENHQIELESLTAAYEDYTDNNNLQSDITEISLNNTLLILLFISILFTALLNFSRRIF